MAVTNYQRPYTDTITAPITIGDTDFVTGFTVIGTTGTVTLRGSSRFQGEESTDIVVPQGVPFTKQAAPYSYLSGWTITPSANALIVIEQ